MLSLPEEIFIQAINYGNHFFFSYVDETETMLSMYAYVYITQNSEFYLT